MYGTCPKCAQQMPKQCGCPGGGHDMPMHAAPPMPMPMPMPMSMPARPAQDKQQMRDAAKQLLGKLQDLDFDKVDSFDIRIEMAGDPDAMQDIVEELEGEGDEEAMADSNVATLDDEKDEEEDKG